MCSREDLKKKKKKHQTTYMVNSSRVVSLFTLSVPSYILVLKVVRYLRLTDSLPKQVERMVATNHNVKAQAFLYTVLWENAWHFSLPGITLTYWWQASVYICINICVCVCVLLLLRQLLCCLIHKNFVSSVGILSLCEGPRDILKLACS